ncbi:MAG: cupin domain-containing protein [Lachnospiraceae bacterium]|nr:cupin domain-containing protein [Lachnospiraceae bacterium]
MKELEYGTIFEKGNPNPFGQYFTGNSYLAMLTQLEGVVVANVTFEPACRNNWHIHRGDKGGGQILLVTGGRGWYQEWGKEAQELHAGDVVAIPVGVKHWHGAAKDSWFAHVAIEVPGENTSNEWLEPVSDSDYEKLK